MNDRNDLATMTFLAAAGLVVIGALLRLMDLPGGRLALFFGMFAVVVFAILCLKEIFASRRLSDGTKVLWLFGFLFFWFIAGLIYLLSERRRINGEYP